LFISLSFNFHFYPPTPWKWANNLFFEYPTTWGTS